MSPSFARRLIVVSTVAIGGVLATIIAALALSAYSMYVSGLRTELNDLVGDVSAYVAVHGEPASAPLLASEIAARFFRPDLTVSVLDPKTRVEVRARGRSARRRRFSSVAINVTPRSKIGLPVAPSDPFGRIAVALATLFGLREMRVQYGDLAMIARANETLLVAAVARFAPIVIIAEALAIVVAYLLARLLTREAVRPLVAVTAALERFGAGDLTPQPIVSSRRHELDALTGAYNRAIAAMERAFLDRDRAQARMRQFIADAGHQLKTPLTVIRGFIAVLRRGELRETNDYQRILETMNRQSLLIGSLIEKLILLERWERGPERTVAEPIDVGRLVEDVVTPSFDACPSRATRVSVAGSASAAIDPSDLAHAVTNLLDNALKYSCGAIDVEVATTNDDVTIAVSDEGPGMTEDERAHAFDRFYRGATRRDVDGSGLGLAIAKTAVERAGGTIAIDSTFRPGARFVITLPAAHRLDADLPQTSRV